MNQKTINIAAQTGNQTIHDVTTGDRTGVFDYGFTTDTAGTIILKDEAGTEFARYKFANAGDGIAVGPVGAGVERFTAVGDLILNLSTSMTVTGHVCLGAKN